MALRAAGGSSVPSDPAALAALLSPYLVAGGFGPVLKPFAANGATVTLAAAINTDETMATIALPAMGVNSQVWVFGKQKKVGTNGAGMVKIQIGAVNFMGTAGVSTASSSLHWEFGCIIQCQNSATVKIGQSATALSAFNTNTLAGATGSVDTSAAGASLTIKMQRANAGDTVSLEGYIVLVFDPDAVGGSLQPPRNQATSANFTLADAALMWVNNSGASNIVYTIDSTILYAVGDVLEGRAGSTGTVSLAISGGTSVLNTPSGAATQALSQGQRVRAQCITATPSAQVWEYV